MAYIVFVSCLQLVVHQEKDTPPRAEENKNMGLEGSTKTPQRRPTKAPSEEREPPRKTPFSRKARCSFDVLRTSCWPPHISMFYDSAGGYMTLFLRPCFVGRQSSRKLTGCRPTSSCVRPRLTNIGPIAAKLGLTLPIWGPVSTIVGPLSATLGWMLTKLGPYSVIIGPALANLGRLQPILWRVRLGLCGDFVGKFGRLRNQF